MAKGTAVFIFFLSIIAALLLGINIGKHLNVSGDKTVRIPTTFPVPTLTAAPTAIPTLPDNATPSGILQGSGLNTDPSCGISFSYPKSYTRQKSANGKSTIFVNSDNPDLSLAVACGKQLPRPDVSSDKIEAIMVAKVPATLYHDKNGDGTNRDEVIFKHPQTGMEIIIAGYGFAFNQVITSLKFLK